MNATSISRIRAHLLGLAACVLAASVTACGAPASTEVFLGAQGVNIPTGGLEPMWFSAPRISQSTAAVVVVVAPTDALFAVDASVPSSDGDSALRSVLARSDASLVISGTVDCFTDSSGATGHNQDLSDRRAASVVAILRDAGVPKAAPLAAAGHGEADPVGDNRSETGRALNRRCTISLTKRRPTATPPA